MLASMLVIMILPVTAASAQVSGGLLPDPIGSPWLTRTLRRQVAPSVVEWIEIENAHEAYLEAFKVLQEGELARYRSFLEESMSGVPDAQTIRKFIRKLEGLRRLIESSDAVLFSEIEEILTEPKREFLVRLRNLRALERLTVAYGSSRSDRAVPLWAVVEEWERDLPPDQQGLVAPILVAYESTLVSALHLWRKSQDQMLIALADELNRSGIDRIDSTDPDSDTMQAFREALRSAKAKTSVASASVSKLNERLIRSLGNVTTLIDHRRIRTAHTQLLSDGRIQADPMRFVSTMERMLSTEDLDAEVRDELLSAFTEYAAVDDRHVRNMLQLIEGPESEDENRLASFDAVRVDLARQFRERISLIAERSERDDLRIISSSGGLRDRDENNGGSSENISIVDQISAGRGGAGHFICRPISRREFELMVDGIVPESWQMAIIDTIYDDYIQAWKSRVEPFNVSCGVAQSNVRRYDPSKPQLVIVDMDQLRTSYDLASTAATEIEFIDANFFESLISTCSDGQRNYIERLFCARSLGVFLRGTDALFRPREVAFSRPNIMVEIEGLALSAQESEDVASVLDVHSAAMLEAGRSARDIRMEVEFESHRLNNEMSRRISEENAMSADYGIAFRDLSGRMASKHGAAMQHWFDSESEFRELVRAVLSDENRLLFDESWKRASNPMVYQTNEDAGGILMQALDLEDLTDDQSVALSQVLTDHRADWNAISDEMAAINLLLRNFGALSDEDSFETWRVLEQAFSRLSFERREVDMRALRRLALYLNDTQRKRFSALQDFDHASGN